jgi:hypothetical protein
MIHKFSVIKEFDIPLAVSVAAYLDCEHYIFLHRSLTDSVEVVKVDGFKVTVRQSWKGLGLKLGHYKTGEYVPPAEFLIYDVKPSPAWFPSVHHLMDIKTRLRYTAPEGRDATLMTWDVELDLPWFVWPLRSWLQGLVEKLHAQQVDEDVVMIKRREKLVGRANLLKVYLADHHFCYHKDDFIKHFGAAK